MAVLFYCSVEMKAFIKEQKQAFIDADDLSTGPSLRKLDYKVDESLNYSLVLATEPDTMRGVDYRAPQVGIMLLIGKSFANAREAG